MLRVCLKKVFYKLMKFEKLPQYAYKLYANKKIMYRPNFI